MNHPDPETVRGLRKVIDDFLAIRRDAKLDKLKPDDPKREDLHASHEIHAWLADAARRVGQIQAATHTLKAIHPDARGTNLHCRPTMLPDCELVGSHLLGNTYCADVIGNAAALDVNKFLTQEYQGQTLLAWMQDDEETFIAALQADDTDAARQWVHAFLGLTRSPDKIASHTLAKQLYWLAEDDPCDDAQFHLLAPLYASSLAHSVYATIQEHRFGDKTKSAREARRNANYCEHILHEYPSLAEQKLGGTKPQNISQLNSERKGVNYLLASCPPVWRAQTLKPPYGTTSIFNRFGRNTEVKALVRVLRTFLESDPAPNKTSRDRRDDLVSSILGEIRLLADEYRVLPAGWSADSRCRLVEAEQCWLDPKRAVLDADFGESWQRMAWMDEIKRRFGNWLNTMLGDALPVGDIEHEHWADLFDDAVWRRQVKSDRHGIEREAEHV